LLNNQLFSAFLLPLSLLISCQGTTGGGNTKVNMQSNNPPTNTPSIPAAEAKTPPPATGKAVRVARWSRNPKLPAPLAPLNGTLAIVNNCLVVKYGDVNTTVVVFPYRNAVWNDAKRTFTYEGKVIRIGEPISLTGQYLQNLDRLKEYGKYDVPDCGINGFFQTF
jgi:hypothetical protein